MLVTISARVLLMTVNVAALSVMHISMAHACACCSEPGMRFEQDADASSFEKDELARIRFGDTAELYATTGFPEDVKGIKAPSDAPYGLRGVVKPARWSFELTDPSGKPGAIGLPMPNRLERFEVDPRAKDARSAGGGPLLYKEWRLKSPVQLSGIVAEGGKKADATLILHGQGNGCTTADDFTHWTLQVGGVDVDFTLLGKLEKPSSYETDGGLDP